MRLSDSIGLWSLVACIIASSAAMSVAQRHGANGLGGDTFHREKGYYYTNPLLDCISEIQYVPPFKHEVETIVSQAIETGKAERVSVNFRQLNNGYSFNINENARYSPASLLKVCTLIHILRKSEKEPELLTERITYSHVYITDGSNSQSLGNLELGKSYSIAELLEYMIVHSDNEALEMLKQHFNHSNLWVDVFAELGIELELTAGKLNIITAREYATIFRVLFNASFLNRTSSNMALKLLCRTTFSEGFIRGIADTKVPVAKKFGLKYLNSGFQFHETAIVYVEGNPYLVSIMTEGKEKKDLFDLVAAISKSIYDKCSQDKTTVKAVQTERSHDNKFSLLNPLLDCATSINDMKPFSKKIRDYIGDQIKMGEVQHVSVYFRQLKNGNSFTIDGEETYAPASLLKVPSMIGFLKESESNPNLLDQKFMHLRKWDTNVIHFKDDELPTGLRYSVRDLIARMIIFSDNEAGGLLFTQVEGQSIMWNRLFDDLGIANWNSDLQLNQSTITVRDVCRFFQILYNATYLNRQNSETALHLLSQTRFDQGLRKGLDPGVVAASKYGERMLHYPDGNVFQFHECAIVYYEDNPYLLGIMTKGKDFDQQAKVVETVSRMVYQEMKRQFPIVGDSIMKKRVSN